MYLYNAKCAWPVYLCFSVSPCQSLTPRPVFLSASVSNPYFHVPLCPSLLESTRVSVSFSMFPSGLHSPRVLKGLLQVQLQGQGRLPRIFMKLNGILCVSMYLSVPLVSIPSRQHPKHSSKFDYSMKDDYAVYHCISTLFYLFLCIFLHLLSPPFPISTRGAPPSTATA